MSFAKIYEISRLHTYNNLLDYQQFIIIWSSRKELLRHLYDTFKLRRNNDYELKRNKTETSVLSINSSSGIKSMYRRKSI